MAVFGMWNHLFHSYSLVVYDEFGSNAIKIDINYVYNCFLYKDDFDYCDIID